jgi:DNA polymerase III epsilon subunit-like protein
MSLFVVDVEADGAAPGLASMVSIGIVRVDDALDTTFYGQTRPIVDTWNPEALAVSAFTREQHLQFDDPREVMERLVKWLAEASNGRPVLISDNPAFDFAYANYYLHRFVGSNPFGHSARRIGDFFAGLERDFYAASRWKSKRKTAHTHHPVDDARGNAEALIAFSREHKVKLPGVSLA